jgi:hypothetical protein
MVAACALSLAAIPARAETAIAAGPFLTSHTSVGGILSFAVSLPAVPIGPQLSIAAPFSGGRYAVTAEARLHGGGGYGGVGIGVGTMKNTGQ